MEKKADRLTTARLVLKPFAEHDRAQIADILCSDEIKKTYMLPDFESREQAESLADRLIKFSRADERFEYGIYLGDTVIGFVNDCEIKDASVEIGYVIAPAYQGKGYATEAVRACIDELLRMGYTHIRAGYFEENTASRRVMEKCGMHRLDYEDDVEYRGKTHHCLYFGIEKGM